MPRNDRSLRITNCGGDQYRLSRETNQPFALPSDEALIRALEKIVPDGQFRVVARYNNCCIFFSSVELTAELRAALIGEIAPRQAHARAA